MGDQRLVALDDVFLGELVVLAALDCQRCTGDLLLNCFSMVLARIQAEGLDWLLPAPSERDGLN